MSDRYTRADCPPPKRSVTRPRIKPWGGNKVGNAAWKAARSKGFAGPPKRQCTAITRHGPRAGLQCCNPAMRGSKRCYVHGGPYDAARWGLFQRSAKMEARRLQRLQEAEDGG